MNIDNTIKVTLVEDHPSYRRVIERALNSCVQIELTNMYGAAETALQVLIHATKPVEVPDVILLDLNLPGMSGLDAIENFVEAAPAAKIIVLTQSNAETDVRDAIRLGAQGYLLKSSTVAEIIHGIETVNDGGASIDRGVAAHIRRIFHDTPSENEPAIALSEQEQEFLVMLSRGATKQQIAEDLDLNHDIVVTSIEQIYEKLDAQNATDALEMAYRTGSLNRN